MRMVDFTIYLRPNLVRFSMLDDKYDSKEKIKTYYYVLQHFNVANQIYMFKARVLNESGCRLTDQHKRYAVGLLLKGILNPNLNTTRLAAFVSACQHYSVTENFIGWRVCSFLKRLCEELYPVCVKNCKTLIEKAFEEVQAYTSCKQCSHRLRHEEEFIESTLVWEYDFII